MKISEVLFKADKVLDERGWYRGNYVDPHSRRVCAIGAIRVAANNDPNTGSDLTWEACEYVERLIGSNALGGWNDNVAHDKRQVQRKFRRAARVAAKDGK